MDRHKLTSWLFATGGNVLLCGFIHWSRDGGWREGGASGNRGCLLVRINGVAVICAGITCLLLVHYLSFTFITHLMELPNTFVRVGLGGVTLMTEVCFNSPKYKSIPHFSHDAPWRRLLLCLRQTSECLSCRMCPLISLLINYRIIAQQRRFHGNSTHCPRCVRRAGEI